MKRCMQTAQILRKNAGDMYAPCILIDDLRECDFGHFENRNYIEMSEDEEYQAWISSGGHMPFPEGEDPAGFQDRCCSSFLQILSACLGRPEKSFPQAGIIAGIREARSGTFTVNMGVHGGTIMSILSVIGGGEFYDFQIENGKCVTFCIEPSLM